MRIAGLPLWMIVLAACALAPILLNAWIDAEQRRTKERTRAMLQRLASGSVASGAGRAASIPKAAEVDDTGRERSLSARPPDLPS
jgi:hypothetical protein